MSLGLDPVFVPCYPCTGPDIEWARGLAESIRPFSSGRYLLNFLGDEGEDTIRAAFGANYDRLAAIKRKYDPENFFRLNQNFEAASQRHALSNEGRI
jgi:hypothetical protein